MKWIQLIPITLFVACSQPEKEVVTEIVYQTDTIYLESKKKEWDLDCGDGTQYEMNVCSLDEFVMADSIMQAKYQDLLSDIDKDIKDRKEYQISGELINHELKSSQKQKTHVIQLQQYFLAMRNEMENYARLYYEGGNMMIMMVNMYKTQITEDQIELLKTLINGPR